MLGVEPHANSTYAGLAMYPLFHLIPDRLGERKRGVSGAVKFSQISILECAPAGTRHRKENLPTSLIFYQVLAFSYHRMWRSSLLCAMEILQRRKLSETTGLEKAAREIIAHPSPRTAQQPPLISSPQYASKTFVPALFFDSVAPITPTTSQRLAR